MITRNLLLKYAPHAQVAYIDSFMTSGQQLERAGITTSVQRTAHFLAQAIDASGGLFVTVESLWFTAREISERWPRLYPSPGDAMSIAGKERDMANVLYGGRMGNVAGTDDAWRFRARGIFRIVGRSNYAAIGDRIGAPLVDKPDLVTSMEWAASCAAMIWNLRGGSISADSNDSEAVTRRMGGTTDNVAPRFELTRQILADLIG